MSAINYVRNNGGTVTAYMSDGSTVMLYPGTNGVFIPVKTIEDPPPPPPEPVEPPPPVPSGWASPLPGARLTSGYGHRSLGFHAGIDLSTGGGRAVLAPANMKITVAKEAGTGGLADAGSYVKGHTIEGTPYTFNFFHMVPGSIAVRVGQVVAVGTKLGVEGNSGYSFGAHLHFEIWNGHLGPNSVAPVGTGPWYWGDGTPPDPLPILRANGVAI